ncbi:hypothetical protein [Fusobacterium sp.]|uniref:hypothetical protein n=1 Tax=Fusobacterium sp. TaxID=68766 RepID=UPI00396CF2C7
MEKDIFLEAKRQLVEDVAVNNELIDEVMLRLAKFDLESYLDDPVRLKKELKRVGALLGIDSEAMEGYMEDCIIGYKKIYKILKMAVDENIKIDYDRVRERVWKNREEEKTEIV